MTTQNLGYWYSYIFTSEPPNKYCAWSCQNLCEVLTFLLDNILFDLALKCNDKLYGFKWALIVIPWLWINSCFVMRGSFGFLLDDKQADVIDAFNTTSRYLDDIKT